MAPIVSPADERQGDGGDGRHAVVDVEDGKDRTGHAGHRADGKVDLTEQQDEHDPECDRSRRSHLRREVREVLGREES